MPFPTQQRKGIPTSIGTIVVTLTDNDGTAANATATATVNVRNEDGEEIRTIGPISILAEMTTTQKTNAWNFMQAVRAKAVAEVLPPP